MKDHPMGPGTLLTAVKVGLGKGAVPLRLRLAEKGEIAVKTSLIALRKAVIDNLVLGRLGAPFPSFLESLPCERKDGGREKQMSQIQPAFLIT